MGGTDAAYAGLQNQLSLLIRSCLKMKKRSLDAFFIVDRLGGSGYDLGSTSFPFTLLPLPLLLFPVLDAIGRRRS